MSRQESNAIGFAARPITAIVADIVANSARGPTPEFLGILIQQQEALTRSAARRNDPEPSEAMVPFETLRDQLAVMKERLPLQQFAWGKIREHEARARREKILARFDPAARAARIKAINAAFGNQRPKGWNDNMRGVKDLNSIGSEEQ